MANEVTVFERSNREFSDRVDFLGGVRFGSFGPGFAFFVAKTGSNSNEGKSWKLPKLTIQAAINAASAGDVVYVAPGDYDEAITITKDNLTLIGVGERGSAAVAPSAANSIAILIDGTTASGRVEEVHLVNMGGEGKGTGGGLHVKGDVRRFTATECKFEGGAFACKLESAGAGKSIGDSRFIRCEFAWTTTGLHFTTSGGADPVTQTYLRDCLFHNTSGRGILSDVSHTTGLWVVDCTFAGEEDGTEPANEFVKVDVASSEGVFTGNRFYLATNAVGKLAIAAGVRWMANATEAGWSLARPA